VYLPVVYVHSAGSRGDCERSPERSRVGDECDDGTPEAATTAGRDRFTCCFGVNTDIPKHNLMMRISWRRDIHPREVSCRCCCCERKIDRVMRLEIEKNHCFDIDPWRCRIAEYLRILKDDNLIFFDFNVSLSLSIFTYRVDEKTRRFGKIVQHRNSVSCLRSSTEFCQYTLRYCIVSMQDNTLMLLSYIVMRRYSGMLLHSKLKCTRSNDKDLATIEKINCE